MVTWKERSRVMLKERRVVTYMERGMVMRMERGIVTWRRNIVWLRGEDVPKWDVFT